MYAHIADDNTTVDRTSEQSPPSMRLKDGRSVSGRSTDPVRLKMGGWVEATVTEPAYDPDLERLVGPTWTVTTEEYVNDEGTYDVEVTDPETGETTFEQRPIADGQTYTVPVSAKGTYTVEPRPAYLHLDKNQIAADDTDTATVEYRDLNTGAPTEVTFDVNGTTVGPVALTDGRASVGVTSPNAGDEIVVSVDAISQTVTIQVGA